MGTITFTDQQTLAAYVAVYGEWEKDSPLWFQNSFVF